MTITSVQASKGLVESGKVKALAVTSPARSPAMPDVPTMQEAGVPPADVELRFWFAIFGPKGLPRGGQGQALPGRCQSDERPGDCASVSPSSTSRRTSSPGRRCTPSSKTRSRTGPGSSTPRASRRSIRTQAAKVPHLRGAAALSTPNPARGRIAGRSTAIGGYDHAALHSSGARSSACLLGLVPLAQAQGTYPDRPIRFVVAFPPGGATDTFFRLISNELGTALGQTRS